jgi:hypothetical protein
MKAIEHKLPNMTQQEKLSEIRRLVKVQIMEANGYTKDRPNSFWLGPIAHDIIALVDSIQIHTKHIDG